MTIQSSSSRACCTAVMLAKRTASISNTLVDYNQVRARVRLGHVPEHLGAYHCRLYSTIGALFSWQGIQWRNDGLEFHLATNAISGDRKPEQILMSFSLSLITFVMASSPRNLQEIQINLIASQTSMG